MFRRTLALVTSALVLVAALGVPAAAQGPSLAPPQATPMAQPPDQPAGDGTGVRLTTDKGDIVISLFNESSPVAAENFLNLVNAGFYDGLTFHRLVPGFVIQGGDPNGDGTGGPGYTIKDEPVVGRYHRGTVAMARTQAPDSQGSQFFIVLDDGAEGALAQYNTYAIFGEVVEGMDVVDQIAAMPNSGSPDNRATEPIHIIKATVEQVPVPSQAPTGDPELEGLFPTTINDQQLQVQSNNGAELRAQIPEDDEFGQQVEGVLATLGATFDDLSIGGGSVGDQAAGVSLTALRVKGADASAVEGSLLPLLLGFGDLQKHAEPYGDKSVDVVTDGPDSPELDEAGRYYVYASGDIVWVLQGVDPWLTDALSQLP
ncbi:MAG: peptidylprolyl isomerase [Chloroflexota bacterium]